MADQLHPRQSTYAVGERLRHYAGSVWEVVDDYLPGDGQWEDGMVAIAGDYLIRCCSAPDGANQADQAGREMRVHRDYLDGDRWRRAGV